MGGVGGGGGSGGTIDGGGSSGDEWRIFSYRIILVTLACHTCSNIQVLTYRF